MTQILMPALSPTMEEGTLAKWLVKVGDTVEAETKKALGLGETDDLKAFCKEYEDSAPSSGMFFRHRSHRTEV